MAEQHNLAKIDYMAGMKYQDIADKYGVSLNTVKSWKKRYGWERTKTNAHKRRKVCAPRRVQISPAVKAVFAAPEVEGLTEKEELFCRYFVNNRNATQAAIKAGYSQNTANVIGYENLRKPHIRTEVKRLKAIRNQAIMLSEDDIVERYMRIAFADMTDFTEFGLVEVPEVDDEGQILLNPDGSVKTRKYNYMNFKSSDQVDGGLICEVSQGKNGMKVKLEDRQKALRWLADYFCMNPMNQHKIAYDKAVLSLRERELKAKEW